eukprot:scaffold7168_cov182-Amphora_coffeaeformis.AAC.5
MLGRCSRAGLSSSSSFVVAHRRYRHDSSGRNNNVLQTSVAIVGAGINGLATAYYLAKNHGISDILILDSLSQPMSFTSAQSGENYRNWWPHPIMTTFSNRSLTLMEEIARNSSNRIDMTRKGYLLATRDSKRADRILQQMLKIAEHDNTDDSSTSCPSTTIRIHDTATSNSYHVRPNTVNKQDGYWEQVPLGIDVLKNSKLIQDKYPQLDKDVHCLFHIRRAGDLNGHALGMYMLDETKRMGGKILGNAHVVGMEKQANSYALNLQTNNSPTTRTSVVVVANKVVNAAGPMAGQVGKIMGTGQLSGIIRNVFHQKVAFPDEAQVIPRNSPFAIDLDPQRLDWSPEERDALLEDTNLAWLAQELPGNVHCRPDGPRGIKLGWAFESDESVPELDFHQKNHSYLNPIFPEIVIRGASRLQPALKAYYDNNNLLPRKHLAHYGGWYSMTEENWPLIGRASTIHGEDGIYVNCAPSGFGTMTACAAGELCAAWVADAELPEYANALSLNRYQDAALMDTIRAMDKGLL